MCFQVDAAGAGAVVMPYALADLGHGLYRLHVRLLFPREVTNDTFCPRALALTQLTLKPNTGSQVKQREATPSSHTKTLFIYLFIFFFLLTLQVQIGGPAGIRGHGGSSCFRHLVHGKEKR